MYGKLFLIPTPLSESAFQEVLPERIEEIINELNHFIVENEKSARHFIKRICPRKPQHYLHIGELPKHGKKIQNIDSYLEPLLKGHSMGLLSEAGLPCIADPGSNIVLRAHKQKLVVMPLSGPSSILMTLMASGLNGQRFAFHGYLPIAKNLLKEKIKSLEKYSRENGQTQLFMETPYRNGKLLEILLSVCNKYSLLTIATDLTGRDEMIKTQSILEWRKTTINLYKRPSLFGLLSF
ncbi:SAM-dependent methyltransferase [Bacteroidetes bacterium endosymbiont of Geopemphigus sp.]|uniref:SAM-dependent methyltransferase n=1 Tax=Bacteroidetes bacterium endosymbiont of Geopemphigus sp. TaxID=2047937 RepID=UPI000CCFFCE1|nr:SAM-dependent methyltransferase [Bacteroidetes bacterium endosymbiont of Geopemphigus sp.]